MPIRDVWSAGIISSDIDEARNRVAFGVLAEEKDEAVEFFGSLHLPCDLVVLEQGSAGVESAEFGIA